MLDDTVVLGDPVVGNAVASGGVPSGAVVGSADGIAWVSAVPFLLVHLVPFLAFFVTVTWKDWVLCAVLYVGRMFLITAGYHRYFAHRSYKMGRIPQFLTAWGATTAAQKGPLWWAGHHRIHHRFTDTDRDIHSPRDGFWWSHVGWILSRRYKERDESAIRDFAAFPELRLVDKLHWVGPWVLGLVCLLIGGWGGLIIGFFLSTVLVWHGTFIVNSLAHVFGRRRFATPDTSRNSLFIALVTGGEGWHNNHHYLPASARQGLMWWEIDTTWYALRALAAVHIISDLKRPPARLLTQARVGDGAFDIGMFRSYWERAARLAGSAADGVGSLRPSLSGSPSSAGGDDGGDSDRPGDPEAELAGAPRQALSGLIHRAMESADELASSTRRMRDGAVLTSRGTPTGDAQTG
ncbi:MAG TPA: acyl-CoA desaturase [Acidimicrobiales bacterium]|nr:acyl-CoA desaturase [Acidimicrobiales bacterium]